MASVHLSYPCDHCSSKILPSVVCGDVGSSTPVSTLLKDAVRLAYDFKKQNKNQEDSAHMSSNPRTALGWLFMCFQESVFCAETDYAVTLVVLRKVNAISQSPAN